MPKLKKLLIFILTFALSLSSAPTQINAVQKTKISKSRLTLYVGNTTKLKIKNNSKKVRWSSSNTSVATVTQEGRISAKKRGNCTITATVASNKYTFKVTVKKKATATKKVGTYVYVTDTGSKYHRAGCRYLWNSSHKIKLSSAKSIGYTACSVCW